MLSGSKNLFFQEYRMQLGERTNYFGGQGRNTNIIIRGAEIKISKHNYINKKKLAQNYNIKICNKKTNNI